MKLPRVPAKGSPIDALWGAAVIAYLRALTPGISAHIRATMLSTGTTYSLNSRPGGGAAGRQPFEIFATSTGGETPEPRIGITPSTLAGRIPSTLLLTPQTGTRYIHAAVTIFEFPKQVVSVQFVDNAASYIADTATIRYAPLGSYQFTDGAIRNTYNTGYGPIGFQLCYNWFSNPTTTGHTFTFN